MERAQDNSTKNYGVSYQFKPRHDKNVFNFQGKQLLLLTENQTKEFLSSFLTGVCFPYLFIDFQANLRFPLISS